MIKEIVKMVIDDALGNKPETIEELTELCEESLAWCEHVVYTAKAIKLCESAGYMTCLAIQEAGQPTTPESVAFKLLRQKMHRQLEDIEL